MEEQTLETFKEIDSVVVRFAGDSGDGMQTVGEQFTDSSALAGNDISTLPDFPAEIRAPKGTLPGVSGFQIQFGSRDILTPGDSPDALVAMNPAALKVNINDLNRGGLLVINTDAFTKSNLKKANYTVNPLEDQDLKDRFQLIPVSITTLTMEALKDSPLNQSEKARAKNFFALGLMYWVYGRTMDYTLNWINTKWGHKKDLANANITVLKAGFYFGENCEIIGSRYKISRANLVPGVYRKIMGNEALVLGLVAASQACNKEIVFGCYPITPASSIIDGLAKLKHFNVKTVQMEDEIAAIGAALGASYAGALGVTATSGPGLCLKSEFVGLAVITEYPLIIIDVQRGGPSTGLPTKTEQADLLQASYGRNGESPVPIVAACTPHDSFDIALEAARIAVTYNTPIILLSDTYIANGSEPWMVPDVQSIKKIESNSPNPDEDYVPYRRDPETLARKIAYPGQAGFEHRVGGLEKNENSGVSYDPENHEKMTMERDEKIRRIAKTIPPIKVNGNNTGRLLVVGWGSTYGAITSAVNDLILEGKSVSSIHLRHLNPFPENLEQILSDFDYILVPELNLGQLNFLLKARYLVDTIPYNKVQGWPFTVADIKKKILEIL